MYVGNINKNHTNYILLIFLLMKFSRWEEWIVIFKVVAIKILKLFNKFT